MPTFKVRVTIVRTEVYVYRAQAPDLGAAQFTTETSDPDAESKREHNEVKRVSVREIKPKDQLG